MGEHLRRFTEMRPHYVARALAAAAVAGFVGAPAAQARFLDYYPPYTPVHHRPVHSSGGQKHRRHIGLRTTLSVMPPDADATT
jgi:hypothetical protein